MHFKCKNNVCKIGKQNISYFENYVMNSNEFKKVYLAKGEENCEHKRIAKQIDRQIDMNCRVPNNTFAKHITHAYIDYYVSDSGLQIEFLLGTISRVAFEIFENFIPTREQKCMHEKLFYLFSLAL